MQALEKGAQKLNNISRLYMVKNRIIILVALLALLCGTANAHRHYHGPRYRHAPRVTTVIRTAPAKRTTVVTRLTKKDRFEMAIAYLKANPDMSVKQYAKMTGMKKEMAEAELNVFAQDALNPIKPVPGKKNQYYLIG